MPFTLIEKVEKTTEQLCIPYVKYKLHNGLTLIVHIDNSNPSVHVDITYHVGSGREEIGKSGFAHFFEHMMFEGSKHVANNEHFKFISEAGGTLNGTTNRDRTNYFETLPNNELDLALWLESDRMGYLLEAMTEESFNNQLSVIKNEKAQRYENQPYGMLSQVTQENLYPINHPYSWTTIGYTEDLDRVSTKDMMAFFKRWYGPNNATLTIGGDVDLDDVLEKIEKYFGAIPSGPKVEKPVYDAFGLPSTRYVSYKDQVRFPMLQVTWPTVKVYHEDEAALDVLSDILGDGKNALLYAPFVKTQKAVQVFASNICYEGSGEFRLGVLAYPNIHLAEVEKQIHEILDGINQNGIAESEVERVRNRYYSQALYSLESVKNKVSRLASYQLFAPELNYIQTDIDRYKRVTVGDVMRVFKKYIYKQNALNVSFYSEEHKNLLPKTDNHSFTRMGLENINLATETINSLGIENDIDRTIKPTP
ncbi:MAG: insulinase family protein, partial [Bacteroidetes bacterium]|nr:insulinase family protein [Bacteroidota bacterium]